MMIWNLIQGLFRLGLMLSKKLWHGLMRVLRNCRWKLVRALPEVAEMGEEVLTEPAMPLARTHAVESTKPKSEVVAIEPVAHDETLVRYGQGFSVVARFYPAQHRVSRTIWLDYKALQRKHGAYLVKRLRSRAGGEFRQRGVKPLEPEKSWGRILLPDEYLEFDSLQDLRVIRFMERSLEDVGILIEEEIPDDVLTKSRWKPQAVLVEPTDLQKRTRVLEMTPAQLREEDQARKQPLASEEKIYANLQKPAVTTSHLGTLRKTGYVERTDPSGRRYRTFYAEVDDGIRTVRHTGVDLQRALLREQVELGDRVEVFHLGLVPVGNGKYRKKIWSARKLPQV
jgi:hypothetical protein